MKKLKKAFHYRKPFLFLLNEEIFTCLEVCLQKNS